MTTTEAELLVEYRGAKAERDAVLLAAAEVCRLAKMVDDFRELQAAVKRLEALL
jgi:hypothetical protein